MGRVSLCIVFFLYLVASVIAASNECGRQNNGSLCDNRVCCSCWGECGTDDYHCLRSYGCQSNCKPEGPHDTNVEAFFTDYNPQAHNWDLRAVGVACSTKDGDMTLEWRSKYNWTGFCGKVGPQGLDACGMCLRVTNSETGAEVMLRIVDTCGSGALEIDKPSFVQIDTNGKGINQGHLIVDYEFVDCGDDASSFISMKSMI